MPLAVSPVFLIEERDNEAFRKSVCRWASRPSRGDDCRERLSFIPDPMEGNSSTNLTGIQFQLAGGLRLWQGKSIPDIGILHDLIIEGKSVMATGPAGANGFRLDIGAGGIYRSWLALICKSQIPPSMLNLK